MRQVIGRKLVIVGSGATGKSCLLSVVKCGRFPEMFIPTVFEVLTVALDIDNIQVSL